MTHKWRAYTGLGLLLLMLAQSLLHPSAAAACLCGEPHVSDGEFVGTVVRVEDYISPGVQYGGWPSHRIIFQVLNAWSGVDTSYVAVLTGRGNGDCGASFDEGVTYRVNVDRFDTVHGWVTNICSGGGQIALTGTATHPYDQSYAEVLSQKGKGAFLRPISVDAAAVASESPEDDVPLLSLLLWVVFLITTGLAVRGLAIRAANHA
jgi:hypothetical protein